MATSERSKLRKPAGRGASSPFGRLGFAVLTAAMAAFLFASVAQAAPGVEEVKVNATGTGKGIIASGTKRAEIIQTIVGFYPGSPGLECSYNGIATSGQCTSLMSNEGAGYELLRMGAFPSPGSEFVKWILGNYFETEVCAKFPAKGFGTSNSTGICEPYVEPEEVFGETTEVTAEFADEPGEPLTVSLLGGVTGGPPSTSPVSPGTVVSNPAGIECSFDGAQLPQCWKSYAANTEVTLTASPATGYAFSAWSGCLTHEGLKCTVIMDKAKTVKATFVATPSLTIEKAGSGYGKVAAMGISCDESCSKESSAVKTGTSVTVKTTPAKGNEAAVIEGGTGSASACSGSTCTFTIEANSSLKVKFNPIPSKTLTVKLTGPAAYKGKVSGKGTTVKGLVSTAILCGTGCTSQTESFFATGTTELVASTVLGYKFAGWTVTGGTAGSCTGTTSPCTLLTDANKTVEAKFE